MPGNKRRTSMAADSSPSCSWALANLFGAITALKALPWLASSVRDIRAFRVEQWSDFTKLVKGIIRT
jgi:virulence-associated protein VapD